MDFEEHFRSVFEHAPFSMCVSGLDGRVTQTNAAFCRMLGYSEQEMLGRFWEELIHPDDRELTEFFELTDGCSEVEQRFLHRGGAVVWTRTKIFVVRADCGASVGHVIYLEDITERQHADEAARESEDRFRVMADACPTIMWVTKTNGGKEFVNRTYREFFGTSLEQVDGDKWQVLLHPDDAPEYLGALERAVAERKPFRAETRARRADGEWRLLGSYAEPRLSPSGEFLGLVGLSADITDRKQAEQAREFQHSLVRAILEASLDGILVVSDAGVILSHNQKYVDIWQIPPASTASAADRPLLANNARLMKDPEAFIKRVRELYDDPTANDHCEIELKDGRTLERYSTSLARDGGHRGRVWFFRDIT